MCTPKVARILQVWLAETKGGAVLCLFEVFAFVYNNNITYKVDRLLIASVGIRCISMARITTTALSHAPESVNRPGSCLVCLAVIVLFMLNQRIYVLERKVD